MQQLILIRGLPGSGKSTLARQLAGFKHFEADMFHIKDGVFQYDENNKQAAHNWCENAVYNALHQGHNVVVSNTFTLLREMEPYLEFAAERGIKPLIVVAKGRFPSEHNVPPATLNILRMRWQD